MSAYNVIESEDLDSFRDRTVNVILGVLVWLTFIMLVGSLFRIRESGWQNFMAGQIAIYVYLDVVALFRRRLSYKFRAYSVVAASFILGVGGLLTWGLLGNGGPYLFLSTILAMVLLGRMAGAWIFAATLALFATLGVAVSQGVWAFGFDSASYAVSPMAWINRFTGYLFCFGLIVLVLLRVQEAMSKAFASLRESNEELHKEVAERRRAEENAIRLLDDNRNLAIRLSQVEEEERKHLARELHDEAGQWLTAAQAYAQIVSGHSEKHDDAMHKNVRRIIESISRAHGAIGSVIRDLRPGMLEELGLAGSLRELARLWQQQNPDVSFSLRMEGELDDLDGTLSITVYRVIQECLTNAAKYGEAKSVSVLVRHVPENGTLELAVIDDGKGMDFAHTCTGFGLRGMQERATAVGGKLIISTRLGEGVRVEANLPARLAFETV